MRPRHIHLWIFSWMVLTGGRFTAPFLKEVAGFNDTLVGLALAVQFCICSLLGSWGCIVADRLEFKYPHRGRCAVILLGTGVGTFAFVMHGAVGVIWERGTSASIGAHFLIRVVYSVGFSPVLPVLDGLTLAFLEEEGSGRAEYGKERVYGAVGWGLASIVIGPLIDGFGFEVMFWLAPMSFVWNLITMAVFSHKSAQIRASHATGESIPLNETGALSKSIDETSTMEISAETDGGTNLTLWSLLGVLCGSVYAAGFVSSCVVLAMGRSVVSNLSFLFFQELGGSNTVCGLTVFVTVIFEFPIFQVAPQLLTRFGAVGLQELACLSYMIRVVGYTFIPPHKVLLVLFLEPLHGVTFAFAKTGGVEFVAKLAPKGYEASCQGLLASLLGLGSVVGLSLGGWAEDVLGAKAMYRLYAGIVACGLLMLVVVAQRREVSANDTELSNEETKEAGYSDDCDASTGDIEVCRDLSTYK